MDLKNTESGIYSFKASDVVQMSAWQPIDINPNITTNGANAVTNGPHNSNYKTIRDAYDDSPTNASIINSFVNFMYANGLTNTDTNTALDISKYLDEDTVEKICLDTKLFGGFALQPMWNDNEKQREILKFEYVPIDKLAVDIENKTVNPKVKGYWYSWDWTQSGMYQPSYAKKFNGTYQGGAEIVVVQRVTNNNFFPLPDYFSCINYCIAEGYLGQDTKNHFKFENKISTVINVNGEKVTDEEVKKKKAEAIRNDFTGGSPKHHVVVSFNKEFEDATTIDQIQAPTLNQQNVFFAEECERKIIVGHSAPKILFSGSNNASGFSSNADEILVATKEMYRRNINPLRKVVLDGLTNLFRLIDPNVKLEFVDFEEFQRKEVVTEESTNPEKV